jgi:hypothetical protein
MNYNALTIFDNVLIFRVTLTNFEKVRVFMKDGINGNFRLLGNVSSLGPTLDVTVK